MNPIDYLKSLIAGHENSSIPVQLSELKALLIFMEQESKTVAWLHEYEYQSKWNDEFSWAPGSALTGFKDYKPSRTYRNLTHTPLCVQAGCEVTNGG